MTDLASRRVSEPNWVEPQTYTRTGRPCRSASRNVMCCIDVALGQSACPKISHHLNSWTYKTVRSCGRVMIETVFSSRGRHNIGVACRYVVISVDGGWFVCCLDRYGAGRARRTNSGISGDRRQRRPDEQIRWSRPDDERDHLHGWPLRRVLRDGAKSTAAQDSPCHCRSQPDGHELTQRARRPVISDLVADRRDDDQRSARAAERHTRRRCQRSRRRADRSGWRRGRMR